MRSAELEVDDGGRRYAETLVHESPDGLIALACDGTIRFWNQGAQALFGYTAQECLGQSFERLAIPADRIEESRLAMAEVLDRGVALFETERQRKDGSRVAVDVALRLVRSSADDVGFIAVTYKDITQVQALREECATETKFRGLLEAAPDAMVIVGPDGRIALVNTQTENLFGYPRAELLGQPIELLVPEHHRQTRPGRRHGQNLFTQPRPIDGRADLFGRRRDGSEFPCEINFAPMQTDSGILVTAAIRDITSRRKAEDKFRALMEAAPDAMVIVGQDGRIVLVNAQTEKLFGYRRDELIGKSAEVLISERFREPDGQRGHFTHPGERLMGSGHELYGLRSDHTEFAIETSSSPLHTEDGLLILSSIRDVTERKLLEERMQQANRLKSEFLANMSHELRTPLNAIIGFTELMHYQEVEPGSNEQKEFLIHILTSGRHLLQLVNDILDLSKIEAGKMEFRPERIDLQLEVQEVVGMLSSIAATKRIEVSLSVEDLGEIMLDPARLKQVLYNYLSNALKFTPEGGRVVVRAKAETAQTFRLEVEDTGVGIRPSDLRRLFVEFHQLDAASTKRHAGTGLGLALTKRIVDAQGGAVGVSSVPGQGSTFHAVLPRRSRLTVHVPQPPSLKGLPGDGPAILVIDDDDADRDLLVRTLGGAGYAVDTAVTANEGIGMLRSGSFDAVTIHLSLPDMRGLKVLQEIRRSSRTVHLPVIVINVVNETGAVSGFAAQDVLPKPAEVETLQAALERAGIRCDLPGSSVLVVDDDVGQLARVKASLQALGLRAICRHDAEAALNAADAVPPDAVILNMTMPQMDGFGFLERFRDQAENREVPVFIWTEQDLVASEPRDHIVMRDTTHVMLSRAGGNMAELLQEMKRVLPRRLGREERVDHGGRANLDR